MTALRWIDKPIREDGVTERRFDIERDGGTVPGILWTPTGHERPVPLVLLGHGGSGHKRSDRQLLLGRRFAASSHIAAVSIDGPFHGDRVTSHLAPGQYLERMANVGISKVIDDMIADWSATVNTLSRLDTIDAGRIAYLGLSMGTRFGLPFVAVAGDLLCCAVLGKNGMRASPALNVAARFRRDAPRITVPVLFHVQWHDELFPRDGQFELFDLIGTHDKRLIAFPGPHDATAPEAIQSWCNFITHHLAA